MIIIFLIENLMSYNFYFISFGNENLVLLIKISLIMELNI